MESEDRLLWNRAFDKFDMLEEKITKLCLVTAETKSKLDEHLACKEKESKRKEKVFYIVITAMGSIFTAFTFTRDLL